MEKIYNKRGSYSYEADAKARRHRYPEQLINDVAELTAGDKFRQMLDHNMMDILATIMQKNVSFSVIPQWWAAGMSQSILTEYVPEEHRSTAHIADTYRHIRGLEIEGDPDKFRKFLESAPPGLAAVIGEYGIIDSAGRIIQQLIGEISFRAIFDEPMPAGTNFDGRAREYSKMYAELASHGGDTSLFNASNLHDLVKETLRSTVAGNDDPNVVEHRDTFTRITSDKGVRHVYVCIARNEMTAMMHTASANYALWFQNFDSAMSMLDQQGQLLSPDQVWNGYEQLTKPA